MKNVKKLMKCSLVLCLALALLCMPLGVFAEENVPNGGTSAEESAMTQEEIFAEALADPNLTDEQRADVLATKALVEQGIGGAPDVEPPMTRAVDNVMSLTTKMQETSTWCSAATIQQMLIYMTGSSPSQQTIINSVGVGPGLNTVLNYVNARQSRKYYQRVYFTSGEQVLKDSVWNACNSSLAPIVYTMSNPTGNTSVWPYPTTGHFTNIIGYWYPSGSYSGSWTYYIADPYYFGKYVPGAGTSGRHMQPYSKISQASANLHGASGKCIGY